MPIEHVVVERDELVAFGDVAEGCLRREREWTWQRVDRAGGSWTRIEAPEPIVASADRRYPAHRERAQRDEREVVRLIVGLVSAGWVSEIRRPAPVLELRPLSVLQRRAVQRIALFWIGRE